MDKKIAGVLGAVATLGAFNAAQAAPTPSPAPSDVLRANSFADLLEPIPNAAALLQAVDESAPEAKVELVQLYIYHHHHHHAYRRYYEPRVVVVPPRYSRYHHHHHHHHHHSFYRRDYDY